MVETARPPETEGTWRERWPHLLNALFGCFRDFFEKDSLMISASIAYYGLLAIFPFLLLLLGTGGIYVQRYELAGSLALVLYRYLPMKPDFILQNLVVISKAYGRVGLASFILLLWSSSGVFVPVEKALNQAWHVKSGRSWFRSRVVALEFSVVFGLFFLLFSGLVGLSVFLNHWTRRNITPHTLLWFRLAYPSLLIGVTFGMTLAMFMILFMHLPNRPLSLREVLPGALVTALFWELSRIVFTLLLKRFNYRHVYGSIGAMVALMTWAYVSAAVMLFGARISHRLYCALYPRSAFEAETVSAPAAKAL